MAVMGIKNLSRLGVELRRWRNLIRKRLYVSGRTEHSIVQDFHKLYYHMGKEQQRAWSETYWRGRRVIQCPMDLFTYAQIIHETEPTTIIETGTNEGGLTCFLADVSWAKIVTIDHRRPHSALTDPRIQFIFDDSLDAALAVAAPGRTMVILDSNHQADFVSKEMEVYAPFVTPGCYLIVCDTHFNGHPIAPDFGPGPWEAVHDFIRLHPEFTIDRSRESHGLTFNPDGFLRRCYEKNNSFNG